MVKLMQYGYTQIKLNIISAQMGKLLIGIAIYGKDSVLSMRISKQVYMAMLTTEQP